MTWISFLSTYEFRLKQRGIKFTNKNKKKLKDAWIRQDPTFSRMFEAHYSEAILDLIPNSGAFLKLIPKQDIFSYHQPVVIKLDKSEKP